MKKERNGNFAEDMNRQVLSGTNLGSTLKIRIGESVEETLNRSAKPVDKPGNHSNKWSAVTRDYQVAFVSNPTPETAKKFIAAYKLLYKTYLEDLDCSDKFLDAAFSKGLLQKVFNWK